MLIVKAGLLDPTGTTFWTLVALLLFLGILTYTKVWGTIGKALDDRADGIKKELDEARRLREDAQALLADYQKKSREAEEEARSIVDQAKREAEALAVESRKQLADSVERRTKAAEEKIARAEAQALGEVRSAAVSAAVAAAEKVLRAKASGNTAVDLIDDSIRNLKGRLN
jgi:F-type H+-transporting ATPase subunit b